MRCSRDNGSIHSTHIDANIKKKTCVFGEGCTVGGGKDARIPASSSTGRSSRRQRRRSFPNANELSKNIRIPKTTDTTGQGKDLRPQKFHRESKTWANYRMHSNP